MQNTAAGGGGVGESNGWRARATGDDIGSDSGVCGARIISMTNFFSGGMGSGGWRRGRDDGRGDRP